MFNTLHGFWVPRMLLCVDIESRKRDVYTIQLPFHVVWHGIRIRHTMFILQESKKNAFSASIHSYPHILTRVA